MARDNVRTEIGTVTTRHKLMKKPTVAEFTAAFGIAPSVLYNFNNSSGNVINRVLPGTGDMVPPGGATLQGAPVMDTGLFGAMGATDGNDGWASAPYAIYPGANSALLSVICAPGSMGATADNQCAFGLIANAGSDYFMFRVTNGRLIQFLMRDGVNTKTLTVTSPPAGDVRPYCVIAGYDAGNGVVFISTNREAAFRNNAGPIGAWAGMVSVPTVRATNYTTGTNSERYGVAWAAYATGAGLNGISGSGGNFDPTVLDRIQRRFSWL